MTGVAKVLRTPATPAGSSDPEGNPWPRIVVSRAMKAATKAARIKPAATFRDLRRTYGSLLINRGTEGAVIQRLLGHADQRMTQRVYTHMLDRTLEKAVRKNSPKFGLRATNVRKLKP
jgi:integrase